MTVGTFGQVLRQLRVERGLSQHALALAAGCDPAWLNRLERGLASNSGRKSPARPSAELVVSLGRVLDLSDSQTDRFLFVAGLAPIRDYQALYGEAMRRLDAVRTAISDDEQPTFIRRATG